MDALLPLWTVVISLTTQLPGIFDHHVHAVRVALAQMPTIEVVRTLPTQFDDATGYILAALTFLAETVVFQLQHSGERKGVVRASQMDILRCDPSHAKDARRGVLWHGWGHTGGYPSDWL